MSEKVAILDCGGQYTKVIDRRVRELEVLTDLYPVDTPAARLKGYSAIILSGGPGNVWNMDAPRLDMGIMDMGVPVLGICYGMQLINEYFGGKCSDTLQKEYGETHIKVDAQCPLFAGLREEQAVLMNHGNTVSTLGEGLAACAWSGDAVAAVRHTQKPIYGVQFHPEVDLTEHGQQMFQNFLRGVCALKERYTLEDGIQAAVRHIRETVGNEKVLVLVSGGVDSAVSAALLLKALPAENVIAIHVNHGLMRKNESDAICDSLKKLGLVHLIREEAGQRFLHETLTVDGKTLGPLSDTIDPEQKRGIIGMQFMHVLKDVMRRLDLDEQHTYWAQGTLRPDLIESGNPDVSDFAHTIKTHHNDVEMVRKARARGLVIETNRDWHKDEVRKVALLLGIPEDIAMRQPFPGPGLGIRVLCSDPRPEAQIVSPELQALLPQDTRGAVLDMRSVGVQGDQRSFKYVCALWGQGCDMDFRQASDIAKRVTERVQDVNRVIYRLDARDMQGSWKISRLRLNEQSLDLLRAIDDRVTRALASPKISQTFVVLIPLGKDRPYSAVIRTFVTGDFMTGKPAAIDTVVDAQALCELARGIVADFPEIQGVFYDITTKPPATCEWQ